MRIAVMIECDGPGGAETMLLGLCKELTRRGHFVLPVGPREGKGTGWLGSAFRDANIAMETFWLDRPIDPAAITRMSRMLRSYDVEVVHSHDFTMAVYGTATARRIGVPHVITMHGGVGVCSVLRRRIALRWAMRHSARTVMVSRATARQFGSELGIPESRFDVIPNGVRVVHATAAGVRREFSIKDREVVILAVGNLEVHKGHRVLIDALARLNSDAALPPWRLIIAGGRGGSQRESLIQQIQDHKLNDKIQIALGRSDIPELQAMADVYAMPSLVEGLPMALLEAMVAGRAVVASRTAGIPEAIDDDVTGLLTPPGDVDALTVALRRLLSDPALRHRLGSAALERSHREFTLEVMTDRYEEMYRRAIQAKGRREASAA